MRALAVCMFVARAASADPKHDPDYHHNRVVHASVTAAGAAFFIVTETVLKPSLSPSECRFCSPNPTDRAVRNALVWSHPATASTISNVEGFAIAPMFALGMTIYDATNKDDPIANVFDQVTPVAESSILAADVTQVVKFVVGRQRPYAHFRPNSTPGVDDNVSFFSGHSAFTFSLATSAGVIAHRYHHDAEPYVWGIGMSLAASTAYLRIAADKHYLTDVLVGGAVGVAMGLAVPNLMERTDKRTALVPTGNGLAVVGSF